jgi:hypothetical protein
MAMPDPRILLDNAFDPMQVLQSYGRAQTIKLEGLRAQRQGQVRANVSTRIANRDLRGAREAAIGGGETGLADAIGKLSDDERKATADGAQAFGSAAYSLRQIPKEQRAQAFDQGVGALAGIVPPEQLAQARAHLEQTGWDDAAIDGYINAATTVDKLLAAQPKPTSQMLNLQAAGITPDDPRYQEAILGSVNPSQYVEFGSDATGRQLIQTRGMGAGAPATQAPTPRGGAAGPQIEQLALARVPGARVTSGARTAAHNAEVGGVRNSYHLTDQARDLVPPQGMSVGQLYQTLQPTLSAQGLQVINEGDHVHVEPARRAAQGGGPRVVAQTAPVESRAEINAARADDRAARTEDRATRTATVALRKEFDALPEVKDFKQVRQGFLQVRTLASKPNPTAQDDIALVYSYMKMLDPGSVVREGEFATAQNAAGVPDTVRNLWNKALTGERLNPKQRGNMSATAGQVYKSQRGTYNEAAERYRNYARESGVSPDALAPKANTNDRQPAPRKIAGAADYRSLPSGAVFIDPNGIKRRKP